MSVNRARTSDVRAIIDISGKNSPTIARLPCVEGVLKPSRVAVFAFLGEPFEAGAISH